MPGPRSSKIYGQLKVPWQNLSLDNLMRPAFSSCEAGCPQRLSDGASVHVLIVLLISLLLKTGLPYSSTGPASDKQQREISAAGCSARHRSVANIISHCLVWCSWLAAPVCLTAPRRSAHTWEAPPPAATQTSPASPAWQHPLPRPPPRLAPPASDPLCCKRCVPPGRCLRCCAPPAAASSAVQRCLPPTRQLLCLVRRQQQLSPKCISFVRCMNSAVSSML